MEVLEAAGRTFEETVAAVPADGWDRGTPCGMSVAELVDHVVTGSLFSALVLSGAPTAQVQRVLAGGNLGSDPVGAVADACSREHAAFAAADPAAPVSHPVGQISLATFVRFRAGDLAVHAWDIARGVGLDDSLPPAVVAGLWEMVRPHLNEMRALGSFGEGASPRLPAETSLQDRLLDAFGRRP